MRSTTHSSVEAVPPVAAAVLMCVGPTSSLLPASLVASLPATAPRHTASAAAQPAPCQPPCRHCRPLLSQFTLEIYQHIFSTTSAVNASFLSDADGYYLVKQEGRETVQRGRCSAFFDYSLFGGGCH